METELQSIDPGKMDDHEEQSSDLFNSNTGGLMDDMNGNDTPLGNTNNNATINSTSETTTDNIFYDEDQNNLNKHYMGVDPHSRDESVAMSTDDLDNSVPLHRYSDDQTVPGGTQTSEMEHHEDYKKSGAGKLLVCDSEDTSEDRPLVHSPLELTPDQRHDDRPESAMRTSPDEELPSAAYVVLEEKRAESEQQPEIRGAWSDRYSSEESVDRAVDDQSSLGELDLMKVSMDISDSEDIYTKRRSVDTMGKELLGSDLRLEEADENNLKSNETVIDYGPPANEIDEQALVSVNLADESAEDSIDFASKTADVKPVDDDRTDQVLEVTKEHDNTLMADLGDKDSKVTVITHIVEKEMMKTSPEYEAVKADDATSTDTVPVETPAELHELEKDDRDFLEFETSAIDEKTGEKVHFAESVSVIQPPTTPEDSISQSHENLDLPDAGLVDTSISEESTASIGSMQEIERAADLEMDDRIRPVSSLGFQAAFGDSDSSEIEKSREDDSEKIDFEDKSDMQAFVPVEDIVAEMGALADDGTVVEIGMLESVSKGGLPLDSEVEIGTPCADIDINAKREESFELAERKYSDVDIEEVIEFQASQTETSETDEACIEKEISSEDLQESESMDQTESVDENLDGDASKSFVFLRDPIDSHVDVVTIAGVGESESSEDQSPISQIDLSTAVSDTHPANEADSIETEVDDSKVVGDTDVTRPDQPSDSRSYEAASIGEVNQSAASITESSTLEKQSISPSTDVVYEPTDDIDYTETLVDSRKEMEESRMEKLGDSTLVDRTDTIITAAEGGSGDLVKTIGLESEPESSSYDHTDAEIVDNDISSSVICTSTTSVSMTDKIETTDQFERRFSDKEVDVAHSDIPMEDIDVIGSGGKEIMEVHVDSTTLLEEARVDVTDSASLEASDKIDRKSSTIPIEDDKEDDIVMAAAKEIPVEDIVTAVGTNLEEVSVVEIDLGSAIESGVKHGIDTVQSSDEADAGSVVGVSDTDGVGPPRKKLRSFDEGIVEAVDRESDDTQVIFSVSEPKSETERVLKTDANEGAQELLDHEHGKAVTSDENAQDISVIDQVAHEPPIYPGESRSEYHEELIITEPAEIQKDSTKDDKTSIPESRDEPAKSIVELDVSPADIEQSKIHDMDETSVTQVDELVDKTIEAVVEPLAVDVKSGEREKEEKASVIEGDHIRKEDENGEEVELEPLSQAETLVVDVGFDKHEEETEEHATESEGGHLPVNKGEATKDVEPEPSSLPKTLASAAVVPSGEHEKVMKKDMSEDEDDGIITEDITVHEVDQERVSHPSVDDEMEREINVKVVDQPQETDIKSEPYFEDIKTSQSDTGVTPPVESDEVHECDKDTSEDVVEVVSTETVVDDETAPLDISAPDETRLQSDRSIEETSEQEKTDEMLVNSQLMKLTDVTDENKFSPYGSPVVDEGSTPLVPSPLGSDKVEGIMADSKSSSVEVITDVDVEESMVVEQITADHAVVEKQTTQPELDVDIDVVLDSVQSDKHFVQLHDESSQPVEIDEPLVPTVASEPEEHVDELNKELSKSDQCLSQKDEVTDEKEDTTPEILDREKDLMTDIQCVDAESTGPERQGSPIPVVSEVHMTHDADKGTEGYEPNEEHLATDDIPVEKEFQSSVAAVSQCTKFEEVLVLENKKLEPIPVKEDSIPVPKSEAIEPQELSTEVPIETESRGQMPKVTDEASPGQQEVAKNIEKYEAADAQVNLESSLVVQAVVHGSPSGSAEDDEGAGEFDTSARDVVTQEDIEVSDISHEYPDVVLSKSEEEQELEPEVKDKTEVHVVSAVEEIPEEAKKEIDIKGTASSVVEETQEDHKTEFLSEIVPSSVLEIQEDAKGEDVAEKVITSPSVIETQEEMESKDATESEVAVSGVSVTSEESDGRDEVTSKPTVPIDEEKSAEDTKQIDITPQLSIEPQEAFPLSAVGGEIEPQPAADGDDSHVVKTRAEPVDEVSKELEIEASVSVQKVQVDADDIKEGTEITPESSVEPEEAVPTSAVEGEAEADGTAPSVAETPVELVEKDELKATVSFQNDVKAEDTKQETDIIPESSVEPQEASPSFAVGDETQPEVEVSVEPQEVAPSSSEEEETQPEVEVLVEPQEVAQSSTEEEETQPEVEVSVEPKQVAPSYTEEEETQPEVEASVEPQEAASSFIEGDETQPEVEVSLEPQEAAPSPIEENETQPEEVEVSVEPQEATPSFTEGDKTEPEVEVSVEPQEAAPSSTEGDETQPEVEAATSVVGESQSESGDEEAKETEVGTVVHAPKEQRSENEDTKEETDIISEPLVEPKEASPAAVEVESQSETQVAEAPEAASVVLETQAQPGSEESIESVLDTSSFEQKTLKADDTEQQIDVPEDSVEPHDAFPMSAGGEVIETQPGDENTAELEVSAASIEDAQELIQTDEPPADISSSKEVATEVSNVDEGVSEMADVSPDATEQQKREEFVSILDVLNKRAATPEEVSPVEEEQMKAISASESEAIPIYDLPSPSEHPVHTSTPLDHIRAVTDKPDVVPSVNGVVSPSEEVITLEPMVNGVSRDSSAATISTLGEQSQSRPSSTSSNEMDIRPGSISKLPPMSPSTEEPVKSKIKTTIDTNKTKETKKSATQVKKKSPVEQKEKTVKKKEEVKIEKKDVDVKAEVKKKEERKREVSSERARLSPTKALKTRETRASRSESKEIRVKTEQKADSKKENNQAKVRVVEKRATSSEGHGTQQITTTETKPATSAERKTKRATSPVKGAESGAPRRDVTRSDVPRRYRDRSAPSRLGQSEPVKFTITTYTPLKVRKHGYVDRDIIEHRAAGPQFVTAYTPPLQRPIWAVKHRRRGPEDVPL